MNARAKRSRIYRARPVAPPSPISRPPDQGWAPAKSKPLRGQIALVAGGTRACGRAISVSLGLAGAHVYVTGRSVPGHLATKGRPETIDETVELIRRFGGMATAIRVDHTDEAQVKRLFERVRREQRGRLDILVNDVWGGDALTEWGKPPWKLSWKLGRTMLERGVFSHIITSRHALPLMVRRRRGIIFEVTDGDSPYYRGSLFYDLVKVSVIRLVLELHEEFMEAGLRRMSAIAVTPGFIRSERKLDELRVREDNWRDAIPKSPDSHFHASETPYYLGRGVVALATDPKVHEKSGKVFGSWSLARKYRFTDLDGTRPDWGREFYEVILKAN
jgi:NAD(P)-dependent dehydrogenase (short-subunit alcohol dehydrogenase family)